MQASKLAALLASHICHELTSPVSSFKLVQDSLGDPDMREHVEDIIRKASTSVEAKLKFLRYAVGSVGMQAGAADPHEAKSLSQDYFGDFRADLVWDDTPEIASYAQMRLVMNMLLIAVTSLPRGGTVTVSSQKQGEKTILQVKGVGPRILVQSDKLDAFNRKEPADGWSAKAIQPYFAQVCAEELGEKIEMNLSEEEISLMCATPH